MKGPSQTNRAADPALRRAMAIPHAEDGMLIGLFGGSFNPPHPGHLHVAETALKRCALHQIWWMVTPGNPLKDQTQLAPLETRLALSREIVKNPRIVVNAIEAGLGTGYSEHTLSRLTQIRPRLRFCWVMGADNLADFHLWQNWRRIADLLPIIIIDRPGSTLSYLSARAALSLRRFRVDEEDAAVIARMKPPAWTFLHGPRSPLSSTKLRQEKT